MNEPTDSLDQIRKKIYDGMYDHLTEKGCSRVTTEVMLDINALIQAARVDELNKIPLDFKTSALDPTEIWVSERIQELNNIGAKAEELNPKSKEQESA